MVEVEVVAIDCSWSASLSKKRPDVKKRADLLFFLHPNTTSKVDHRRRGFRVSQRLNRPPVATRSLNRLSPRRRGSVPYRSWNPVAVGPTSGVDSIFEPPDADKAMVGSDIESPPVASEPTSGGDSISEPTITWSAVAAFVFCTASGGA